MRQSYMGGAHHLVQTGERHTLFRVDREVLDRLEGGATDKPTVFLAHRHCVELDNLCLDAFAGKAVDGVSIVPF
jgi:hypothetical protein